MKFNTLFLNWKKTLILFGLGLLISLIYLFINGFSLIINYCDAFFIAGFIIFSIGALSTLSYFGAFNTLGYSFYALGRVFSSKKEMKEKKYEDLVDYVEKKKQSRKGLKRIILPYVYIAIIFFLLAFFLFFFV